MSEPAAVTGSGLGGGPARTGAATSNGVPPAQRRREDEAAPPGLQSVTRALHVLELIASRPDGMTAKEVSARVGMPLPTVYRLLTTLVDSGYLIHLASEHKYGLGYRVRLLDQGLVSQLAVTDEVAETIRMLHHEADAAAYYAVYRGVDVVVAHVVDSERRPRVQILDVGFHEATHATAFGKVMLAGMSDSERESYLDTFGLPALTPNTITDRARLQSQLAHVRRSNVALEVNEFQPGLTCMAAPVTTATGQVVASVAVSLRSEDFAPRRWDIERAVRQGASRVTRALARSQRHSSP